MRVALMVCGLALVGCRPAIGDPDYPDVSGFVDTDIGGGLPGDTPWDGSTPRLSFGAFYEGGASQQLLVDDESVFYYIYQGYSQSVSSDRVEGFVSDELTLSGSAWWGGAIQMADGSTTDVSAYDTLHLALRSEDASMDGMRLGMAGTGGEVRIDPADYGFVTDGEWHVLRVPLADFAAANLSEISVLVLIVAEVGEPGTALQIDDLYLEGT